MTTASLSAAELQHIRSQFPALVAADSTSGPLNGYVFAENAGGSQVLSSVADAISSYLLTSNVQMAAYPLAKQAESRVSLGSCAAAALVGAPSADDVMIGQSATSLVASLGFMIENRVLSDRAEGKESWEEGDEIILSDADHETNRGAWTRMADRLGLKIKHWAVTPTPTAGKNKFAVTLDPGVLAGLVNPNTKLVAFTACSNLLGAFTDIPGAVAAVRAVAPKAIIAVDCVAFAPHRRVEPIEWGVDVAFFSLYKTYGAHVGAMYVSPRVKTESLERLNHFFLQPPSAEIPGMYPFQNSSVQYELNHSIAPVADYLVSLGLGKEVKVDWNSVFTRTVAASSTPLVKMSREEVDNALDAAFAKIAGHEAVLLQTFIPLFLKYREKGIRIVGPEEFDSVTRAPTVAFAVVDANGKHRVSTSKAIHTKLVEEGKVGAQQGHMYAHKLVQSLGLDLADGVVRLSFVHYNTKEEVERVVGLLEKVFETVL